MRTIAHRLAAVGATAVVVAGSALAATPAHAAGAAPVSGWTFYHAVPGTTYSAAGHFVTAQTTDPEGDLITIDWLTAPVAGMTLSADGAVVWEVPVDFCGTMSLQYRAFDGTSYGNTTSVDLWAYDLIAGKTVSCGEPEPEPQPEPEPEPEPQPEPNTPPSGLDDWFYAEPGVLEVMPASSLAAWGTDPDGDQLSVVWEPLPLPGMTVLTDGTLEWPVPLDFCGTVDVQYRLFDGEDHSDVITLEFRALGEDGDITCEEPPAETLIAQHDWFGAAPGETITVPAAEGLLVNDIQSAGAAISVASHGQPSLGELALASDGSFTWTAPADFCGETTFSYAATDGVLVSDSVNVTFGAVQQPGSLVALHCEPAEEPVEPTEPTEPVEPTEPTEPVEPTEPTQPAEPTEPASPELPTQPLPEETLAGTPRTQLAVTGAPERLLVGLGAGALLALLVGGAGLAGGVRRRSAQAR